MRTPPARAIRRARGTCRRGRSPPRRGRAPRTSSAGSPHEHAEARDERFTEEEHPGHARGRPRHEDERHRQREQPMGAVEELLQTTRSSYFVLLIAAKMLSAPISFAYASITGSTSFFICARSVNVMRFNLPAFSSASSLAVSSEDSTWRP